MPLNYIFLDSFLKHRATELSVLKTSTTYSLVYLNSDTSPAADGHGHRIQNMMTTLQIRLNYFQVQFKLGVE